MEDRAAGAVTPLLQGRLAHQSLFDLLDILVPDDNLQVAEVGHASAGADCVAGRIPWRGTPIADPPLAREDAPITTSLTALDLAAIAAKRHAQFIKRQRGIGHLVHTRGAQVTERNRAPAEFDQAQVLVTAIGAQGAKGTPRDRPHFGPFHVASPAPTPTQLGDVGATSIARDSGSLDLDAHSLGIPPPGREGKFFTTAAAPLNKAVHRRNSGSTEDRQAA